MKKDPNAQLRAAIRDILKEAMPNMARVDQTVAQDAIGDDAIDYATEVSMEAVHQFHTSLLKALRRSFNNNLIGVEPRTAAGASSAYSKASIGIMSDQLGEQIGDLQMVCAGEIEDVLMKYAKEVATLAARAAHDDWD